MKDGEAANLDVVNRNREHQSASNHPWYNICIQNRWIPLKLLAYKLTLKPRSHGGNHPRLTSPCQFKAVSSPTRQEAWTSRITSAVLANPNHRASATGQSTIWMQGNFPPPRNTKEHRTRAFRKTHKSFIFIVNSSDFIYLIHNNVIAPFYYLLWNENTVKMCSNKHI